MSAPAQTQNDPAKEALSQVARIRSAAARTQFARKVFTQGANGLSPSQITKEFTAILKLAGVEISHDVQIGLDVVQVLLAGGAFVPGLNQALRLGSPANLGGSAASTVNAGINALGALSNLLADLGILSPEVADYIGLGSAVGSAATLFLMTPSGPIPVTQIIGAVLGIVAGIIQVASHIEADFFGSIEDARDEMKKAIRDFEVSRGAQYAVDQLKLYSNGQLNYFDLIGNIALEAPGKFKTFFPELAAYFPSWLEEDYVFWGESQGIFEKKYVEERRHFITLLTNRRQVKGVLVNKFILAPASGFLINRWGTKRISLRAISTLAMILTMGTNSPPVIDFGFDVLAAMAGLGLTPALLGDTWLFRGGFGNSQISETFDPATSFPYPPMTLPLGGYLTAGVSINGRPALTAAEQKQNTYTTSLIALQQAMFVMDDRGDLDTLLKIPEARAQLAAWADWFVYPSWSADPTILEPTNLRLKPGHEPISRQSFFVPFANDGIIDQGPMREYFKKHYMVDLADYWKTLSVVAQMEKANLFADPPDQAFLNAFGDMAEIEAQVQSTYQIVLARVANESAKQQIATYLGVDSSRLQRRVVNDEQGNSQIIWQVKSGGTA